VKLNVGRWLVQMSCHASSVVLLGTLTFSSATKTNQVATGERATIAGSIVSRNGDLIRIHENNTSEQTIVAITENTKIKRSKGKFPFYRHTGMDVTAMLPGLTIKVEGVGNADGQLEADTISFTPDEFAIDVAEHQQVIANKSAARNAQFTADESLAVAKEAQSSADRTQASANEVDAEARAVGTIAVMSVAAMARINERVSDLDDYKNEFEVDVCSERNKDVLDRTARRDLANLADIAKSLNGYLIEISGYSSNTLSKARDQKLSEERAESVVRYLTQVKNVPMRRILVPIGYGVTHPVASNNDAKGRELNRRVDIKVLVNQALAPTM
jgi:outer membrane protein OmpA-like peptidoglycan-associated protein